MTFCWDTVRQLQQPGARLKVHNFNPHAKAKPGRLYRWDCALFFVTDDGYALTLPDDQIASMIKAGLLPKDVFRQGRPG